MTYETGFPTFSVYAATSGNFTDPSDLTGDYNNAEQFDFKFSLGPNEDLGAINCSVAIREFVDDETT